MELLDALRSQMLGLSPLAKFAIAIAVIVGVPPLARRVGLPEAVGLLLFGVVLGPHVLGLFGEDRPIANFFAVLGKLLLMFSAGLEIDVARRGIPGGTRGQCCGPGTRGEREIGFLWQGPIHSLLFWLVPAAELGKLFYGRKLVGHSNFLNLRRNLWD